MATSMSHKKDEHDHKTDKHQEFLPWFSIDLLFYFIFHYYGKKLRMLLYLTVMIYNIVSSGFDCLPCFAVMTKKLMGYLFHTCSTCKMSPKWYVVLQVSTLDIKIMYTTMLLQWFKGMNLKQIVLNWTYRLWE